MQAVDVRLETSGVYHPPVRGTHVRATLREKIGSGSLSTSEYTRLHFLGREEHLL